MPTASVSLPVLPANRPLRLTPTDVSQFVRLEQCERYLRFRLAERAGQKFMEEYAVTPRRITPLLSPADPEFDEGIENAPGSHFRTVHYPPGELAQQAYRLNERFHPSVPEGKKGWGASGDLDLGMIEGLAREKK
jgi:hypothetical protein